MEDIKLDKNSFQELKEMLSDNIDLKELYYANNDDTQTSVLKKGGKMKHKIHIKKENRGKFTEYCGGKVTSECIQRGKNSSDPKIRKRATFAANVRKWKHQNGGKFDYVDQFKRFIRKNQTGGQLYSDKQLEKQQYDEWNNLSFLDKLNRNFNIAKSYIQDSPSIYNLYNAANALLGGNNPQNPYLNIGIADVGTRKQSVAKNLDKGVKFSRKVTNAVKQGLSFSDGDLRHVASGRSRYITAKYQRAEKHLLDYMKNTPQYKQYINLIKKEAKFNGDKVNLDRIKKLKKQILQPLIDNGIIL